MSTFGTLFRVSTFGESHGVGVGCILDGVPANMSLTEADIQPQLTRRRPGQSSITTQRQETDQVKILSGTEQGKTLGTPIGLLVHNQDQRKFDYANTADAPRPGHADYTYQIKYGTKASSGGGRASARETIARVAAGAVAEKWLLEEYGVKISCWVSSVLDIDLPKDAARKLEQNPPTREQIDTEGTLAEDDSKGYFVDPAGNRYDRHTGEPLAPESTSPDDGKDYASGKKIYTRCPHPPTAARMAARIQMLRAQEDSGGGICTCVISGVPVGLGEPCFDKLEADLAKAMVSLPAVKAFEIGSGFNCCRMRGSEHNDLFADGGSGLLKSKTNHAGGTLGGISSGEDIVFRIAIKPASSISQDQETCTFDGKPHTLSVKGRHDPCVLPRAPPLVEGMAALVIADACMRQRARSNAPLQTLSQAPEAKKARTS
jgi:chorismate synthase